MLYDGNTKLNQCITNCNEALSSYKGEIINNYTENPSTLKCDQCVECKTCVGNSVTCTSW